MLNRKLSQYIFIGSLVLIAILVFVARFFLVGGIRADIETTELSNFNLTDQITELEELVQDNKDVQTGHLYDLYDIIPNVYSGDELTYKTVSILERLGVTEETDMQRTIRVDHTTSFAADSIFAELSIDYYIVEVDVFFTTQDATIVKDFIDELYNSEQLFIVSSLSYNVPEGEDYIGVTISFLAIYDVVIEIEEES